MTRRPRAMQALREPPAARTARARLRALAGDPPNDWYRIENLGSETTAVLYLHDEIGYFGLTSADFVRDLAAVKDRELHVHINSPGGDVFDGIAIYNAIRAHPKPVTVYVDALAASAASFIAMAGDRILIEPTAQLMLHDAHGMGLGNAADMREYADLLDKCSDNIASIYGQRAGGTTKKWRAVMAKDAWYSADEAVAAGLADEVLSGDRSTQRAQFGGGFKSKIQRETTFAQFANKLLDQPTWDELTRGLFNDSKEI